MSLPFPLPDLVALVFFLGGLPAAALAQLRLLDAVEIRRVPAYLSSVVTLAILGTLAWFVGARDGGASALGLGPAPVGVVAAWTVALVLSGLVLVVVFRQGAILLGVEESPLLRALMPRTPGERGLFAVLSVAAGVSEEMVYRGYALTTLAVVTGPGWAAVVTSVIFGALHAYQGWLGVVRTAALGGVLAWGYLASGSLWAPLAAHVVLDLVLGIVLAERLMVPETRSGVRVPRMGKGDAGGVEDHSPKEQNGSGSGASR